MGNEIFDAKAKVLERIKKSINERGIDRMDIAEMETLSDIVKDLAEADYYCTVTEAMQGNHGYDGGYPQGYMPEPMGYGYGLPPSPFGLGGPERGSGGRRTH